MAIIGVRSTEKCIFLYGSSNNYFAVGPHYSSFIFLFEETVLQGGSIRQRLMAKPKKQFFTNSIMKIETCDYLKTLGKFWIHRTAKPSISEVKFAKEEILNNNHS